METLKKLVIINDICYSIVETSTRSENLIVDGSQCYGTTNYYTQAIYIDETLTKEKKRQTLRHELTHAFISCHLLKREEKYDEEMLCEFVALYSKQINDIVDEVYPIYVEKNYADNEEQITIPSKKDAKTQ